MKNIFFILFLLFLIPSSAVCEQTEDTLSSAKVTSAIKTFDPVAATNTYINALSAKDKAMSDKYFEGNYWHMLWAMIIEILIAIIFLFSGLSLWMEKISRRVKNVNLQNLIYIVFYLVFSFLLTLPYSIYKGFIREHQFGLSNMSFDGWFGEELINLLINVVLLTVLLLVIYFVIRKTQKYWWIWASVISTVFFVIVIFISPVFIAPLFNTYTELPAGKVRTEILSLARANGIPADHVYEFNASKQSKRISANVSGIGRTIRISLNDNLLNRCTPAEIKAVMAHEMGHYLLHHIQRYILIFGVLFFVGFWLVDVTCRHFLNKFGQRWKVSGMHDIGGLPLLMAVFSFFIFLATPLTNNISRITEAEADIFGINASREPDGFARAAMMTSEYRKVDPGHWEEIIFYDHPSPHSRVLMAMKWKAENLNDLVAVTGK